MPDNIKFEPVPFEEAAKIIRDRPAVTREVFKKMLPEIRAKTILISGVEDMNVVQQIRDLIAEIPRGGSWEDAKKQIVEQLGPWMDEEAATKRATLLMRHHGFQAYAAAHYREMDEQRDLFPYWKYLTMGDERVREAHAKLHGLILPAGDPFWDDHYPPWDWGCRCQIIPVTESEYLETVGGGRVAGKMSPDYATKTRGWSLGPEGLNALHNKGILDDGDAMPVGVDSPAQRALKTDGPAAARDAYQWHPGEADMSLEQIKSRYDAETWQAFERQAKSADIGDGRSLLDWLEGKATAAGKSEKNDQGKVLVGKQGNQHLTPLEKSIRDFERDIASKAVEHLVIMDAGGKALFPMVKGTSNSCKLPLGSNGKISGAHLLHNHPSCIIPKYKGFPRSLSLEDVRDVAIRQKAGSVCATGIKRSYSLAPGPAGWPNPQKIGRAYSKEKKRVMAKLEARFLAGKMKEWQQQQLVHHLVWKAVANKFGMQYTVTRRS